MDTTASNNNTLPTSEVVFQNDNDKEHNNTDHDEENIASFNNSNNSNNKNTCFQNLKCIFCQCQRKPCQCGKDIHNFDPSSNKESNVSSSLSKEGNVICPEVNHLPPLETWSYRPLFIQPANDTRIYHDVEAAEEAEEAEADFNNTNSSIHKNINDDNTQTPSSIPIGKPIEFETSLFKGKILVRIKNNYNIDTKSQSYFQNRKRMRQFVIQGQFKEKIKMSHVYVGDFYERPLGMVPPPFVDMILRSFFKRLAPGIIMDLSSDKPKVAVLLAGSVQIMSIDKIGHEPDILEYDMQENTKKLHLFDDYDVVDDYDDNPTMTMEGFKSSSHRQQILSQPDIADRYFFHPGQIYTFNSFDDVFDLAEYKLKIPMIGSLELVDILNSQASTIRACTLDGRSIYNFNVFHEKLYQKEKGH